MTACTYKVYYFLDDEELWHDSELDVRCWEYVSNILGSLLHSNSGYGFSVGMIFYIPSILPKQIFNKKKYYQWLWVNSNNRYFWFIKSVLIALVEY